MSKWKFWKKESDKPDDTPAKDLCPHCGKHVLRQSKLSEFADITPRNQTRLTEFTGTTERVGMQGNLRKYRGSI